MRSVSCLLTAISAAFALMAATPGIAQDKYPSKPIRIITSFAPGGVTDLIGRILADILQKHYKQPVIVESKPGASGAIAQQYVLSAKPDGYTLISGGLGGLLLPRIMIPNYPVDSQAKFVPIAQVAEFVNVMVVPGELPVHSVKEFVELVRTNSRSFNFSSQGVGTSAHMTGELFNLRTGMQMVHVPYKSSGDMLVAMRRGDVHVAFANLPVAIGQIKSGHLKALAVTSTYRSKQLPDVSPLVEAGISDFDVTSWLGLYGPIGIPQSIVTDLSRIIVQALSLPENRSMLEAGGFEATARDATSFAALNRREDELWRNVARHAGITQN